MTPLIWVLSVLLITLCSVLIFFILGQDVKGGGLAGALGGGSVQSAFGTKTTETLLKITTYLIVGFFLLIIVIIIMYGRGSTREGLNVAPGSTQTAPAPASVPAPVSTPAPAPPPAP